MRSGPISRRQLLATLPAIGGLPLARSVSALSNPEIGFDVNRRSTTHFDPAAFNVVGEYDFDWLLAPEFAAMLDLAVASPGAIGGVRSFGIFTMGTREQLMPAGGGVVWTDAATPPDFTLPFAALEALTERGLVPFISLGFFPPAISDSPITPPSSFDLWQELVEQFFRELMADQRFGPESIGDWHVEVWNEPNEGRFWNGSFDDYLRLYRATSDAVARSGAHIRLGGPAIAYKPESSPDDGPGTMRRFLDLLHAEPDVQCDFISYHRKGTVDTSAPNPHRLRDAALEIAGLVAEIVPERGDSLTLINNEADEKIGFETPYLPRMGPFAASWLSTLATTHTALSATTGVHFAAMQDNLNLQLMETPFDGRRSIYTFLDQADRSNLVKTSGAVWYDILPFLQGNYVPPSDSGALFPDSDLHAMCVTSESSVATLVTRHPLGVDQQVKQLSISLTGIDWSEINVIEWRIDETHANAYSVAVSHPGALSEAAGLIREKQELALVTRRHKQACSGSLGYEIDLAAFATSLLWITPFASAAPPNPGAVSARAAHDGDVVSWQAVESSDVLGYEVARDGAIVAGPIRPCCWIDSSGNSATYQVRAINASGIASAWVTAQRED